MAYTQTPFEHFSDIRLVTVSRSARWLDLEAKGWCNEHRTDGALPTAMLPHITDAADPQADAAELVNSGLWVPTDTGWHLDWSQQETKDQVEDRQNKNRERQTEYRVRAKLHGEGDHSKCVPRYCKEVRTNALLTRESHATNSVSNALITSPQTIPDQPQPVRAGEGLGNAGKARPATGANAPDADERSPAKVGGGYVRQYEDSNGDTITAWIEEG